MLKPTNGAAYRKERVTNDNECKLNQCFFLIVSILSWVLTIGGVKKGSAERVLLGTAARTMSLSAYSFTPSDSLLPRLQQQHEVIGNVLFVAVTMQIAFAIWLMMMPHDIVRLALILLGIGLFDWSLFVSSFSGGLEMIHVLRQLVGLGLAVLAPVLAVWGMVERSWYKVGWSSIIFLFFSVFLRTYTVGYYILLLGMLVFASSLILGFLRTKQWVYLVLLPLALALLVGTSLPD